MRDGVRRTECRWLLHIFDKSPSLGLVPASGQGIMKVLPAVDIRRSAGLRANSAASPILDEGAAIFTILSGQHQLASSVRGVRKSS